MSAELGRVAVASGLTVGLVAFVLASVLREDAEFLFAILAAVVTGITAACLVLLWGWAL